MNKLKIAIVAPPFGDTGGPEVATQNLTDALVEKGIDVTLFAPADWKTKAKHVPTLKESLWNMKDFLQQTSRERANLIIYSQLKVLEYASKFDIIHLNSQAHGYLVGMMVNKPVVLSLHNRIKDREFEQIRRANIIAVSLSKGQKGKLKTTATIWNGVPIKNIEYSLKEGDYLIVIGRLADQKGIDIAIKIAKKANKKLLIFGRIGNSKERQKYYHKKIKPYIDKEQIIYKKEVSHEELLNYLKNAEALLFPIIRPEVCPMVVAEALACGTPVISSRVNPLPELLHNSKVAFLADDISELVTAAKNTDQFDRRECRKYAEKYFDSSVTADKYIKLYKKILNK